MADESIQLSAKTYFKSMDSIHKVKYSDGVVDGENKSFQSSFDMGYEEGFRYGFSLGYNSTIDPQESTTYQNQDVNCLICIDNNKLKDNVMNLYNLQKERNEGAMFKNVMK